jgi:AraC-like DNA-binding protein
MPRHQFLTLPRNTEAKARELLAEASQTGRAAGLVNAMFAVGLDQLCAKRLASHLQISRATLHRRSHTTCGHSVGWLCDRVRLAVILASSLHECASSQELARRLGMADRTSLRRLARRAAGMDLLDLRRRSHAEGRAFAELLMLESVAPDRPSGVERQPWGERRAPRCARAEFRPDE